MVITNIDNEDTLADISFDIASIGLSGNEKIQIKDAYTDKVIQNTNGCFQIAVSGKDFRLVNIGLAENKSVK